MRLSGQADNLISFWFDLFVIRETYNRYILEITVFVCGALVMIFEIIGSRILSPFIGTSTYVWTSLIGIILGALSLGYWLGGRIADRRPDKKVLGSVILAAGALVAATVLIKEVFLSSVGSAAIGLELKAVIASLVLFGPASVCLGIVTPFAVRLKMTSLDNTGQTVGRLYALSTIGSIVGTFVAGFLLIPFVGSVRTLYMIAGTLMALSFLVGAGPFTSKNIAAVLLLVLGISASEGVNYLLRTQSDLYDIDTEYSRVQVFRSRDTETGREFKAIATDPYFAQSAMYLDDGSPVFDYIPFYKLVGHFNPGHRNALMIGGAGYTLPREYLKENPEARIDVVEIDLRMTEIARTHFGLTDEPRMSIFHEDGRVYLNRAHPAQYDAVFIDAFGSLFSIPFQLTTVEAVSAVHRTLKDNGVVIVNIGSAFAGPAGRFLQAEYKTYKAVFPDVVLFKVRPDRRDEDLQNAVLIACKGRCTAAGSANPQFVPLLSHRFDASGDFSTNTLSILTDDLAPVEYYNSLALSVYRR